MTDSHDFTRDSTRRWPEGAIVYHVYPRSLQDSNGDGIGDLRGVIQRLDYLLTLNINAIWISPFYPSPMADFGYDVSDYRDVDPLFGTLEDFKELLAEAARRNIKVIIDLIPNHTSDEHQWFVKSRSSRNNPYANWYVWQDPGKSPDDGTIAPPNNWLSVFSGESAWEWDETRQQFYLHTFDVKQADLNWSNPEVRSAMRDVMRFWLDMGVDGFRVDAVYCMGKDPLFGDDSPNPKYVEGQDHPFEALIHDNSRGWPVIYAYLSELAEVLREEPYRTKKPFMVAETFPERHNPLKSYLQFYVGVDPDVAAPFNFEGVSLSWNAQSWRRFLLSFHRAVDALDLNCIASYAFGNHDQSRLVSRIGVDAARSAAVMLLTLPGMAFIYYGEEIGMTDVPIPAGMNQDPEAKADPLGQGRDPERTPMQWTPGRNAGFSEAQTTWLPVGPDYPVQNVETQSDDPASMLSLYRKLGELRNNSSAFKYGSIEIFDHVPADVLGYIRRSSDNDPGQDKNDYLVLINFADHAVTCLLNVPLGELVVSSDYQASPAVAGGTRAEYELRPYQAVVYVLDRRSR